jgi:2-polyprenyl-3-methyl-5-hydroxy-6-metoxy-1,4-benzoquinol methylase
MASTLSYVAPFTAYPYVGESIPCIICGETATELIAEHDRRFKRLRTVACRRCGLIRTDPMPTAAEVERYYKSTYRWDYQFTRRPSRRHLRRHAREAHARLALLAPALHPGARILDFGSGTGTFLGLAKHAGYEVLGIEPGGDYARFAREAYGVEVIEDTWEQINGPLGPFDVITAVEVMEHLRDPVAAMRWLAPKLAETGVLYVTVPNILPNGKETFRRFHFAHLHNFTPTTLRWAAAKEGFEPDPRFVSEGTHIVFRKSTTAVVPAFTENLGPAVRRLYPDDSIGRYILTGGWLLGRFRQLRKTIRDSVGT